ncbi:MAG TPA: alpha/beta fold hydrolase, partial [Actinomycetota bacterium]|nr:alpha/beta fold hydrolase [Actinomycetota bacterium]
SQRPGARRAGLPALAFDFGGFGDSRPGSGPGGRIDGDVAAATAQLRRRGADRVVLIGSSMGATAVLSAAARIRPPVAGVVSLSGPGRSGPSTPGPWHDHAGPPRPRTEGRGGPVRRFIADHGRA